MEKIKCIKMDGKKIKIDGEFTFEFDKEEISHVVAERCLKPEHLHTPKGDQFRADIVKHLNSTTLTMDFMQDLITWSLVEEVRKLVEWSEENV